MLESSPSMFNCYQRSRNSTEAELNTTKVKSDKLRMVTAAGENIVLLGIFEESKGTSITAARETHMREQPSTSSL